MADTKISALGNASALGGTEKIPGVQGGGNVNITPAQIATYLGINSGTYTPTATNVSNCAAITMDGAQWLRVGNIVTVSGRAQITPTAGATLTRLRITLPVSSNFTDSSTNVECIGTVGVVSASADNAGIIQADTTNDQAQIHFYSVGTGANIVHFHFTYRVA